MTACLALWLAILFPLLKGLFSRSLDIVLREAFRQQQSRHFFGQTALNHARQHLTPPLPQPTKPVLLSYLVAPDDNLHTLPSNNNHKSAFFFILDLCSSPKRFSCTHIGKGIKCFYLSSFSVPGGIYTLCQIFIDSSFFLRSFVSHFMHLSTY